MNKPYSEACERNKKPILDVFRKIIDQEKVCKLLEIGSGTGQHAMYIAPYFPNLRWTTSDLKENHAGIKSWIGEGGSNTKGPITLEIGKNTFPKEKFDIIYTANTFHIMSWKKCELLVEMCGNKLSRDALVVIYGPFNYGGEYTSDSNKKFDQWIAIQDSLSAIRSFEDVSGCMKKNGFSLLNDFEMPANNRMLVFKKIQRN